MIESSTLIAQFMPRGQSYIALISVCMVAVCVLLHYEVLRVISRALAHQQCKVVAAVDETGVTHAMVVFIWDDKYVYYFLSSRERNVAHVGAVSLLLWTGIELAHSLGLWFDFDGGVMKDARYKFLVSFGGKPANRFEVARSTPLYRVQQTLRRAPRAIMRKVIVPLLK